MSSLKEMSSAQSGLLPVRIPASCSSLACFCSSQISELMRSYTCSGSWSHSSSMTVSRCSSSVSSFSCLLMAAYQRSSTQREIPRLLMVFLHFVVLYSRLHDVLIYGYCYRNQHQNNNDLYCRFILIHIAPPTTPEQSGR